MGARRREDGELHCFKCLKYLHSTKKNLPTVINNLDKMHSEFVRFDANKNYLLNSLYIFSTIRIYV